MQSLKLKTKCVTAGTNLPTVTLQHPQAPLGVNAVNDHYPRSGIYPKYVVFPGGVPFKSKSAAIKAAREEGGSYVEAMASHSVVWERRRGRRQRCCRVARHLQYDFSRAR